MVNKQCVKKKNIGKGLGWNPGPIDILSVIWAKYKN